MMTVIYFYSLILTKHQLNSILECLNINQLQDKQLNVFHINELNGNYLQFIFNEH